MLAASTDNLEGLNVSQPSPIPKPHLWQGVKQGLEDAKASIENRDLDKAEQLLRTITEFAPAEPEAWHILAAVLNRQGQTDEARICLKRVIKLKETNISLRTDLPVSKRMAQLLWAQGDQPAALSMLAELLLNSPDDAELLKLQQTWTASS